MAVRKKDWWIYQERRKSVPWAIHLFATKDGKTLRTDAEVYAEWISNDSHRILFHDIPLISFKAQFSKVCERYGYPLEDSDEMQIDYEIKLLRKELSK